MVICYSSHSKLIHSSSGQALYTVLPQGPSLGPLTFSVCSHSLGSSPSFKASQYQLNTEEFQIYFSRSDFFPKLQIHVNKSSLDIFIQVSKRHHNLIYPQMCDPCAILPTLVNRSTNLTLPVSEAKTLGYL
jgi:hypothetical protein